MRRRDWEERHRNEASSHKIHYQISVLLRWKIVEEEPCLIKRKQTLQNYSARWMERDISQSLASGLIYQPTFIIGQGI
jgi:hypothetical protein